MGDPVRYFRSTPEVYESIRQALDAAWGYPNADTKTQTAIPLVSELAADANGTVYLYMPEDYCNYVLPSQMLRELLASGAVEELEEAAFWSAITPPEGS